jgi:uncharacterized membrane protein
MSKARKVPRVIDRLRVSKQDRNLPKLFDMISLISAAFAIVLGGGGLAADFLFEIQLLYTRSIFTILMFSLVVFGSSIAIGKLMRTYPDAQESYFKQWFGAMVVIIIILIFSLGLFY